MHVIACGCEHSDIVASAEIVAPDNVLMNQRLSVQESGWPPPRDLAMFTDGLGTRAGAGYPMAIITIHSTNSQNKKSEERSTHKAIARALVMSYEI